MPEAVFLSIRRRPPNEAGAPAILCGYVTSGARRQSVTGKPDISVAEAFRLAGIERGAR